MIHAIITDFDGTLVDTFEANLRAYQLAFHRVGIKLTAEKYRECFGYRFDRFMTAMGIYDDDLTTRIREIKKDVYPQFFDYLRLNHRLIMLIDTFHAYGIMTAVASTAREDNLKNVINHFDISGTFDRIFSANDVKLGKPSPEIYIKAMQSLNVDPTEVMIFEDSEVGLQAAAASGANYIQVTNQWFER